VGLDQPAERLAQEGGFAGAGAGDEADDEDAGLAKSIAQRAGKHVVVLQHLLANLQDAGLGEVGGGGYGGR
jgi:hypothetical protein